MLLLLQTDWNYWTRSGLLGAILFVVGAFLYKKVWPLFEARFKQADLAQASAQHVVEKALEKAELRIEKAERMQETLLKDFHGAIEENNRVSRRVAESLDELLRRK